MTIQEFGAKLRAGAISSEEMVERCLARIAEGNKATNAFILVMTEDARQQAREADRQLAAGHDRGPLHGVPLSIKDLMDVRGTETTAASRVRMGAVARRRACVAHLRAAGAVFVGKTNLHEYALGTTSGDSAFGAVRNPLDTTRSPGGSSGGSAVSVATGMALATVGTDTGGSIRIPAACCGIVGLKPSIGEVSTDGVDPPVLDIRPHRTTRHLRFRCVDDVPCSDGRPDAATAGRHGTVHDQAGRSATLLLRHAGR
jgi:aspartyl-tRNA(Asn)/glutamyl-tRNA(Gln) amidotransferase subunit A